jgi:murein DD-endopeptidase MepM/ murein hydrolase activator NlpD
MRKGLTRGRIRLLAALAACAVLALSAAASAPSRTSKNTVAARAFAVQIVVPGADGGGTEEVTAPPDTVSLGGSFAFPADGSVVTTGSATASASASGGTSVRARSSAQVDALSIFGGEITATRVTARARAAAGEKTASGDTSGTAVSGLAVLGQPATTAHVSLADWGYADVSTGSSGPVSARGANAFRSSSTALTVVLTAPHAGLPARTQIAVGFADASARAEKPAPKPKPSTPPKKAKSSKPPPPPKSPPEPKPNAPPAPHAVPRSVSPHLTPRGYVFPVFGPSSWADDFGVPSRIPSIGFHHGIDIFAPLGAPVLAVNDGEVFSVGYIPIGGNRLWLRDDQGNEFYYAHLSAFAPNAVDGRRVLAGDVLGYVGNTGDARGGPFHLHFEIHPVGLLRLGYDGVVDPARYLSAWQHLQDVNFPSGANGAAFARRLRSGSAAQPGAFLLQASDISESSGLDRRSLRRALAGAPTSSGG